MKKNDAAEPLSATAKNAAQDCDDDRPAPTQAPSVSESVRRALAGHCDDADYMSISAPS